MMTAAADQQHCWLPLAAVAAACSATGALHQLATNLSEDLQPQSTTCYRSALDVLVDSSKLNQRRLTITEVVDAPYLAA